MYKSPSRHRQNTLFWDLETMLDSRNPLFKLANLIDWSAFESALADHRLGRNFYKGLFGDSVNVMLAAAAFNFKRVMNALLRLILEWLRWLMLGRVGRNCRLAMVTGRSI